MLRDFRGEQRGRLHVSYKLDKVFSSSKKTELKVLKTWQSVVKICHVDNVRYQNV